MSGRDWEGLPVEVRQMVSVCLDDVTLKNLRLTTRNTSAIAEREFQARFEKYFRHIYITPHLDDINDVLALIESPATQGLVKEITISSVSPTTPPAGFAWPHPLTRANVARHTAYVARMAGMTDYIRLEVVKRLAKLLTLASALPQMVGITIGSSEQLEELVHLDEIEWQRVPKRIHHYLSSNAILRHPVNQELASHWLSDIDLLDYTLFTVLAAAETANLTRQFITCNIRDVTMRDVAERRYDTRNWDPEGYEIFNIGLTAITNKATAYMLSSVNKVTQQKFRARAAQVVEGIKTYDWCGLPKSPMGTGRGGSMSAASKVQKLLLASATSIHQASIRSFRYTFGALPPLEFGSLTALDLAKTVQSTPNLAAYIAAARTTLLRLSLHEVEVSGDHWTAIFAELLHTQSVLASLSARNLTHGELHPDGSPTNEKHTPVILVTGTSRVNALLHHAVAHPRLESSWFKTTFVFPERLGD